MVTRRHLLVTTASGSALAVAGCLFGSDDELPVRFSLINGREQQFDVELTLTDDADETLFEATFDVPARPSPEEDAPTMFLDDVASVPDGEAVHARLRLDDERFEERFEIICNDGWPENVIRFVIRREPEAELDDVSGLIEFQQLSSDESC